MLDSQPTEILKYILGFLDANSILSLRLTNSYLSKVVLMDQGYLLEQPLKYNTCELITQRALYEGSHMPEHLQVPSWYASSLMLRRINNSIQSFFQLQFARDQSGSAIPYTIIEEKDTIPANFGPRLVAHTHSCAPVDRQLMNETNFDTMTQQYHWVDQSGSQIVLKVNQYDENNSDASTPRFIRIDWSSHKFRLESAASVDYKRSLVQPIVGTQMHNPYSYQFHTAYMDPEQAVIRCDTNATENTRSIHVPGDFTIAYLDPYVIALQTDVLYPTFAYVYSCETGAQHKVKVKLPTQPLKCFITRTHIWCVCQKAVHTMLLTDFINEQGGYASNWVKVLESDVPGSAFSVHSGIAEGRYITLTLNYHDNLYLLDLETGAVSAFKLGDGALADEFVYWLVDEKGQVVILTLGLLQQLADAAASSGDSDSDGNHSCWFDISSALGFSAGVGAAAGV